MPVFDIATGEARDHTPEELAAMVPSLEDAKAALREAVNEERDRRIVAGFTFNGTPFDNDPTSLKRITGAAALAGFALTIGGKQPGDLYWHDGEQPFAWIAADNSIVTMDAVTTFQLGQAAAENESAHIFAARAMKDAIDAAGDQAALDAIDIEAGWP